MTLRPVVSVVIPAYNAGAWIGEQLAALDAQVAPPTFEVVVADNGSTDDTAARARAPRGRFDVRVVDASATRGAAHARNVGAAESRGGILAFCDADDLVGPHWLSQLTRPFLSSTGILAAGALHHERFNRPSVLDAYGIAPDPGPRRSTGEATVPLPFAGYLPTVAGGNFAIRRDDYRRIGGMDASFREGSEETDFSWRAQEAGMTVLSIEGAVVHYRLKQDWRSLFRQQRLQQRGRMLLWTRWKGKMHGPSWRASILALLGELPRVPSALRSPDTRLEVARIAGGHIGALEGMVRYRTLRRIPGRALIADLPSQSGPGHAG